MTKLLKKWFGIGHSAGSNREHKKQREQVVEKTREGTEWAISRYRGALEKLAEYDRS